MKYINLATMEITDKKDTWLCIPFRSFMEMKGFEPRPVGFDFVEGVVLDGNPNSASR